MASPSCDKVLFSGCALFNKIYSTSGPSQEKGGGAPQKKRAFPLRNERGAQRLSHPGRTGDERFLNASGEERPCDLEGIRLPDALPVGFEEIDALGIESDVQPFARLEAAARLDDGDGRTLGAVLEVEQRILAERLDELDVA